MITWAKKNRILVLKIAAVVAYFIFAAYGMISYSVLPDFESLSGMESFVQGIVVISLMLYLFTWLYKWVVREKVRGWHVQSVLIVVKGDQHCAGCTAHILYHLHYYDDTE